jgi:hypothetical protein
VDDRPAVVVEVNHNVVTPGAASDDLRLSSEQLMARTHLELELAEHCSS